MMNGSNPDTAARFQVIRGGGPRNTVEAERLDRFLADADPLAVAAAQEEGLPRHRRLAWGFALLLGLATVAPFLWSSSRAHPGISSKEGQAGLLIAQGQQLAAEDREDEALARFSLAVQLAPRSAEAWTSLGITQLRGFQSTLAERSLQRALALEPDNQHAILGLGNLYLRLGKNRRAEEVWRRGKLDQQLARLYLLEGRFEAARAHLAPLLKKGPGDELLYRMAIAARSRHLEPGLRSLLEPDPAGLSSWAELGWRLSKQKRYGDASVAFGRALDEVPHDVNALSGMGTSLLGLNRPGEAKVYFERALRLHDDHMRSLNGLALCLKSEGRIGDAIAVWRETSRRYPGVGVNAAIPGLAWTYYEIRDYRQAAVYFAQIVKERPYDARVIDALNIAVQNLGSVSASPR
jgi:tetratricopeptide (TPR) repeat protein